MIWRRFDITRKDTSPSSSWRPHSSTHVWCLIQVTIRTPIILASSRDATQVQDQGMFHREFELFIFLSEITDDWIDYNKSRGLDPWSRSRKDKSVFSIHAFTHRSRSCTSNDRKGYLKIEHWSWSVLNHWSRRCRGNVRRGSYILDHWRCCRIGDDRCGRHVFTHRDRYYIRLYKQDDDRCIRHKLTFNDIDLYLAERTHRQSAPW